MSSATAACRCVLLAILPWPILQAKRCVECIRWISYGYRIQEQCARSPHSTWRQSIGRWRMIIASCYPGDTGICKSIVHQGSVRAAKCAWLCSSGSVPWRARQKGTFHFLSRSTSCYHASSTSFCFLVPIIRGGLLYFCIMKNIKMCNSLAYCSGINRSCRIAVAGNAWC